MKNFVYKVLTKELFIQDVQEVARTVIGKVIFHKFGNIWLKAQIIETEAYYKEEKGSHSSLGYTEKRKALFMEPGTIYMYYARGGDSFNVSVKGEGNAVLIKSGYPYLNGENDEEMIREMQRLNPNKNSDLPRHWEKLCSGQTLLCKSLNLKVPEWDARQFNDDFFIADVGYIPKNIVTTTRLGIPVGRDEHLEYRFVDYKYHKFTSRKLGGKLIL